LSVFNAEDPANNGLISRMQSLYASTAQPNSSNLIGSQKSKALASMNGQQKTLKE
jgi:hypothetical protein